MLALLATLAQAEPVRLALVVSSDHGMPGEEALVYANSDAQRVARLLQTIGGFRAGDVWVVSEARVDAVYEALRRITTRAADITSAGGETSLLVFYAGHAGPDGLHLGGQVLPLPDLKGAVRVATQGDRIFVLDACHAGTIARSRGATLVNLADQPDVWGKGSGFVPPEDEAWLVSSGPEERSFEVEDRRGALFTHFFLSGARGAADADGNARITMSELYSFVQTHTAEAAADLGQLQQPRWAGTLGSFAITNVGSSSTGVRVVGPVTAPLLVIDQRAEQVVAEVPRGAGANLALDPGSYEVVAVHEDGISLGRLQIQSGNWTLWSPAEQLDRVSGVRTRGGLYDPTPWGVRAGYTLGVGTVPARIGAQAIYVGLERALGRGHALQLELSGSVLPYAEGGWSGNRGLMGARLAWTREVFGRGLVVAPGLAMSGGLGTGAEARAADPVWGAWFGTDDSAHTHRYPFLGLEAGSELSASLPSFDLTAWVSGGLSASASDVIVLTPSARVQVGVEVPFR